MEQTKENIDLTAFEILLLNLGELVSLVSWDFVSITWDSQKKELKAILKVSPNME